MSFTPPFIRPREGLQTQLNVTLLNTLAAKKAERINKLMG